MHTVQYITRLFVIATCCWLCGGLSSCTKNFDEINTDKSKLMAVGPKELAGLFSRSQKSGVSWLTTDNYSRMSSTILNHFCGYTACGNYPYEENQMNTGWQNSCFNSMYTGGYAPLKSIMEVSEKDNPVAYHVALIWKVYLFHQVTDLWGPIPYTEAGNGQEHIPYESQQEVYGKMFADLAKASGFLSKELSVNPGLNAFGTGDMIYNGSVSKWLKFANTLRLRLALRISNADPGKAKTEAEAAATGPMLDVNDDNAMMAVNKWTSGGNGIPRMQSFYQDVMSTSMESYLSGYKDPRLQEFFSPVEYNSSMDAAGYPVQFKQNIGGYHGMTSGYEPGQSSYLKAHSNYGPRFKDGNQLVTPINILHAAETWFLKAEGAWRGWNMGGTEQELYEKGITLSIQQWRGISITADSIKRYIAGTAVPAGPNNHPYNDPPVANIPVKLSADKNTRYEQIITQKWIALFPISTEAFAEYRRTRLPKLYAKKYSVNANVLPAKGQIVTRIPFTTNEKSTQPGEVEKAIKLLGGQDLENTPLWWDIHPNK